MSESFTAERRRVQRVRLLEPLRARIGGQAVFILDASLRGLRVAHQERLAAEGDTCVVRTEWHGRTIELKCLVTRSQIQRRGDSQFSRTLYHSGLSIVATNGTSAGVLRDLIHEHVARAMDEQKANARGIPPLASVVHQPVKNTLYVRHELTVGQWRQTITTEDVQPENGFTVSADHSDTEVAMLRAAYERGGRSGRDLIRRLAQLSLTPEIIPMRRYTP